MLVVPIVFFRAFLNKPARQKVNSDFFVTATTKIVHFHTSIHNYLKVKYPSGQLQYLDENDAIAPGYLLLVEI